MPDRETAAELSMLIDKSRAAMEWNRLPADEQNIHIIVWFETLADAGVPQSRWGDCHRAARGREIKRREQGKDRQVITADDLCVEWAEIKRMHRDIDESHLLPANALAACQKCFGVQPHVRYCDHEFADSEPDDPLLSAEQAKVIHAGMLRLVSVKSIDRALRCDTCELTFTTARGFIPTQVCPVSDCMGLLVTTPHA